MILPRPTLMAITSNLKILNITGTNFCDLQIYGEYKNFLILSQFNFPMYNLLCGENKRFLPANTYICDVI